VAGLKAFITTKPCFQGLAGTAGSTEALGGTPLHGDEFLVIPDYLIPVDSVKKV
jgi:hypothetical protein